MPRRRGLGHDRRKQVQWPSPICFMDTIRTNKLEDAVAAARRLSAMGITIRSPELSAEDKRRRDFGQNGNRALRRANKHGKSANRAARLQFFNQR